MKRIALVLALGAAPGFVGCGGHAYDAAWTGSTTAAPRTLTVADVSTRDGLLAQASEAWLERASEARTRDAISAWKRALEIDPSDAEGFAKLARAYHFLADAHLSFDERRETETAAAFEAGARAAERGLMTLSPVFAERMSHGAIAEEQLGLFDTRAASNLYWRAINLHRWSAMQGSGTVRRYSPDVRASMTKVLELAPNTFHGGAYRFFGEYYGRARPSAGGDLERARANFEQALRIEPRFFAARVQLAEIYAVPSRNRAVFNDQIDYVLMSSPDEERSCCCNGESDLTPENAAEQKRARKLLDQARVLFR